MTDERIAAIGCLDESGALSSRVWDILHAFPTVTRDGSVLILESPSGTLTLNK
ncbi:MAG TPA: hypothetical protein VLR88_06975 [Propionibacteriaceae bacterium]|nr:hypothetical protein [Propionibacteriaceae bacterium]